MASGTAGKDGRLNGKVIDLLSDMSGVTTDSIKQMISGMGIQSVDEIDKELERMTERSVPLSDDVKRHNRLVYQSKPFVI